MNNTNKFIFINGKIFTSNPENPYASAMVIHDGRIEWIGEEVDSRYKRG